ncbi:MAG: hypothetical protein MRJ92_09795 [Nitrospira sp.]|nr:hypothetical protein [Nitrospira sp.]
MRRLRRVVDVGRGWLPHPSATCGPGIEDHVFELDPINVDPGTIEPYQHGEVYVTEGG